MKKYIVITDHLKFFYAEILEHDTDTNAYRNLCSKIVTLLEINAVKVKSVTSLSFWIHNEPEVKRNLNLPNPVDLELTLGAETISSNFILHRSHQWKKRGSSGWRR